jgi:S-formylglutathione hydrolase FrmB
MSTSVGSLSGFLNRQRAIGANKKFQDRYTQAGGSNATFDFPAAGNRSWPYRGAQFQALKPDLIATLNGCWQTAGQGLTF